MTHAVRGPDRSQRRRGLGILLPPSVPLVRIYGMVTESSDRRAVRRRRTRVGIVLTHLPGHRGYIFGCGPAAHIGATGRRALEGVLPRWNVL